MNVSKSIWGEGKKGLVVKERDREVISSRICHRRAWELELTAIQPIAVNEEWVVR